MHEVMKSFVRTGGQGVRDEGMSILCSGFHMRLRLLVLVVLLQERKMLLGVIGMSMLTTAVDTKETLRYDFCR